MKIIPCPVCDKLVEIEIDEEGHPTLYDGDGMFHRCSRRSDNESQMGTVIQSR